MTTAKATSLPMALAIKFGEAQRLLEKVQWRGADFTSFQLCPCCYRHKKDGHRTKPKPCQLARLIGALP